MDSDIMDFFSVVNNRHSTRAFKNREVEEEKIKQILETVNKAPSAGNLQAYEIVLIRNKEKRDALTGTSTLGQKYIGEAPLVLVFCASPKRSSKYGPRGSGLYCIQDATIAASYAQLAATALGLSSVWIGAFDEKAVSRIINAKDVIPVAIIPIGYPDETPQLRPRRDLSDIVHNEKLP